MSLTAERLREVLDYDPDTGVFRRRMSLTPRIKVGDMAGTINKAGYVVIYVDGKLYYGHRLAWLYTTGEWPKGVVDHRRETRASNRRGNLRDVPQAINLQNQRHANARSKTGLLGVSKHSNCETFYARIGLGGASRFLGCFETAEAAHGAYMDAKRVMHAGHVERSQ